MTWATLTHAEMAEALRALLAANPLPPPRTIYAAPDGRHQIPRPVVGGAGQCPAGAAARTFRISSPASTPHWEAAMSETRRLPAIYIPAHWTDRAHEWAARIGTLPFESTVDDVAMILEAAMQEAARLTAHERDEYQSQRDAVLRERNTLRALLRDLEWSGDNANDLDDHCPLCGAPESNGHAPDCRLDAVLKEANRG